MPVCCVVAELCGKEDCGREGRMARRVEWARAKYPERCGNDGRAANAEPLTLTQQNEGAWKESKHILRCMCRSSMLDRNSIKV